LTLQRKPFIAAWSADKTEAVEKTPEGISPASLLKQKPAGIHLDDQIHDGHVGGGHTQSHTVQLALQLWQNQSHSLGRTSGGGHNVEGSGTSTAQIPVGGVQQALVTGVGVGGGHGTLDDVELLVQHLQGTQRED